MPTRDETPAEVCSPFSKTTTREIARKPDRQAVPPTYFAEDAAACQSARNQA